MKKMITISMLLGCFCLAGYAQASPPPPVKPPPVITGSQAVDCIQTNTSLILSFNQSLGEIKVVAWNKKTVYSETIYAFSSTTLTVPTSSWSNGHHAICTTNSRGQVVATFNVQIQN